MNEELYFIVATYNLNTGEEVSRREIKDLWMAMDSYKYITRAITGKAVPYGTLIYSSHGNIIWGFDDEQAIS